uniref:Transmembrane protein n=1 Tax=Kalanchoe fedtschenkoi TaxID=63787 RepID=A0A7N0TSJ6_KALFE
MSLAHQNLIWVSKKSRLFNPANPHFARSPNLVLHHRHPCCNFDKLESSSKARLSSFTIRNLALKAVNFDAEARRGGEDLALDRLLSVLELLSLASSAVLAVGIAVSCAVLGSRRAVETWVGSKFLAWQVVVLVGGVVVGAWIRRRQWRRIWREEERVRKDGGGGGEGLNLLARVEKLEEDVRSSVTILRVLSRQVEKLGIRFRVSRKSLKEPIAETAALAQKNSEATRALAVQEDLLEKELGEIQKVLLAMQEQQQKQLELILAIAKTGKLLDNKPNKDVKGSTKKEPIFPKFEPVFAADAPKEAH